MWHGGGDGIGGNDDGVERKTTARKIYPAGQATAAAAEKSFLARWVKIQFYGPSRVPIM